MKSIKSKKWYLNQIKCLNDALNSLHNESCRLGYTYFNDIASFDKANKPLKDKFDKLNKEYNQLKNEFYLYYKS